MIPIETIKRLAVECEMIFNDWRGDELIAVKSDQLQAFAHAIEAVTIDRCAEFIDIEAPILAEAIRALKDK